MGPLLKDCSGKMSTILGPRVSRSTAHQDNRGACFPLRLHLPTVDTSLHHVFSNFSQELACWPTNLLLALSRADVKFFSRFGALNHGNNHPTSGIEE
ncbi:hypothetical protein B0T16DRAFT_171239 [Cercophora newfieldiana]|uniref:Uncharacterized protein n=1 Tax=Cercophora newfieldiana TaxID=92897 RepID=A0AA39Y6I6_9PEZI|nr:hypothetical protein B0T16DRAFT_171239 [Cercophora newfieldiana]